MKIYTKSGDDGKTGLFHGPRVPKDDQRIEAYGTVDELCSVIGVARAAADSGSASLDEVLMRMQEDLFALGAELATPEPTAHGTALVGEQQISWLEQQIDQFDDRLPPLSSFVLPAGTSSAAALHHARVVCRRAERRVVALAQAAQISRNALIYLNRMGDLLFVLARFANFAANRPDVSWHPRQS